MKDFNNIQFQDIPDNDNNRDFYDTFKSRLQEVEQFPALYTFKFIVKNDEEKQAEVKRVFEHPSSKFTEKDSSGGKYKSITVETFVNNADEVVNYYQSVSKIDSVIML